MEPEEYNDDGSIKPKVKRKLSFDQEHRIHETKDLFDGECSLCQDAAKKGIKTYWGEEE